MDTWLWSLSSHRYAQCTGGNVDVGRITGIDHEMDAAECTLDWQPRSSIKIETDRERQLQVDSISDIE